ncbi:hypothetical protein BD410DRAFT_840967 [Rickenella mellea]|uniref:F-box domain-containing protein n=1 Tax=Rickenella mellea TaxID=50990 RepID=A0A4Y7PZD0_9AGAM|nr:hypothetical protein BD410DRAFT_840967 [Rickenella mellea]
MANTMEISLDRGIDGEQLDLLVDSDGDFAPFASVLKLRISEKVHFMHLFTAIGQYCDIAHTVHFDLPKGTDFTDGLLHDTNRYTPFPSIRHIQFTNCASLYEEQLDCMVKHPLLAQIEDFEIVSCPNISEDFLLDLRNEVGDKLKWSSLIPFHPSENHDSNNEDTEHYYPPPDSPQFDF